MAIADDFSVSTAGDIRYTGDGHHEGAPTYYTVIEVHRFLQDLADDAVAAGDDLLDITDDTPSDRSTDNIVTLINGYNIDDTAAEHLYDGSIKQGSGPTEEIYSGLVIVGAAEAGTELQIVQNGLLLRNYWGTGINADAAQNILMRLMVKTRVDGVDIDKKRLRVQARELSDRYAEFSLTAGLGNSTAAIFTSNDLNNQTAEASILAWDGATGNDINNTEGLALIDVNNDGTDEQYYSEWNKGTHSINDLYEFTKLIEARPSAADSIVATGTNRIVDNGTITSMASGFTARTKVGGEKLTSAKVKLKVGLGTPGDYVRLTVWDDSAGPNAIVATSDLVLVNQLTATYQEMEFVFGDNVTLTSGGTYYLAIEHVNASGTAVGTVTDYVHADSDNTDTNRYEYNVSWGAATTGDLWLEVYSSPVQHAMPGNVFRGITHSMGYDTEAGTPTLATNEKLAWGTLITCTGAITGTVLEGEAVHEDTATPTWKGQVIAVDTVPANDLLLIRLESGTITGTDTFTCQTSGATGTVTSSQAPQGTGADANGGGMMALLAFEDDGTDGELYVQLLYGSAPVDNEELYVALDTADSLPALDQSVLVSVAKLAITARTIAPEFIGVSTGSAIIGAYGIGIEFADLSDSDQLFDLTNTLRQPPVQATFTVSGMEVSVGGRLLVGPRSGSALDTTQMTVNATISGPTVTQIDVTTGSGIPIDTPSTGFIRIVRNSGVHSRIAYTAIDRVSSPHNFTIGSTDFSTDNADAGNGVYIGYLDDDYAVDTAQFTLVYNADRNLFVRFRDGRPASAIKTFQNANAVLQTTGGSATVIRTPDV